MPAAHEALNAEDRILGVGDLLMLGDLTHEALAFFGKGDDGGREPAALGIN